MPYLPVQCPNHYISDRFGFHWSLYSFSCVIFLDDCFDISEPCREGEKYPDMTDCDKYYQCVNGLVLGPLSCQVPYVFDIYRSCCAPPDIDCDHRCPTTAGPTTTTPTTTTTPYTGTTTTGAAETTTTTLSTVAGELLQSRSVAEWHFNY